MDYTGIFEISASGMDFQRARMEAVASNLANVNTSRGVGGRVYQPLDVVARSADSASGEMLTGVGEATVVERNTPPRVVYNPGHPDADARGYVTLPNINPVEEMVNMMTATRAYEANVRAMNAARMMALRALEIGGND